MERKGTRQNGQAKLRGVAVITMTRPRVGLLCLSLPNKRHAAYQYARREQWHVAYGKHEVVGGVGLDQDFR